MSSLAFTPGTQGSAREVSLRYKDVVPTGWDPVGLGRYGVPLRGDARPAETGLAGDGVRKGPSDRAGPDAGAQEVTAAKASRAAMAVTPRRAGFIT
ncbi:hypothetical protein [Nonomuraea aurantiaca]|uniref:hypothetical protein n=1 Tax=Nonomuraea aurantiaca TaxID=2878562 RepID=UPI001CD98687|nr:hypothetical protein [Nonomuraea aurantiaca]MCA2226911.1 hypothetical protein [Nonomuraea aurantiaca]